MTNDFKVRLLTAMLNKEKADLAIKERLVQDQRAIVQYLEVQLKFGTDVIQTENPTSNSGER